MINEFGDWQIEYKDELKDFFAEYEESEEKYPYMFLVGKIEEIKK